MKLKKIKKYKFILLKIFVLQQKNKLKFNILLKQSELMLLVFLWKTGYILGFTFLSSGFYTLFLKKQFKQFSINFLEHKLNSKNLYIYNKYAIVGTNIIICDKGLQSSNYFGNNIGGFLLCNIF